MGFIRARSALDGVIFLLLLLLRTEREGCVGGKNVGKCCETTSAVDPINRRQNENVVTK